MSQKKPSQSPQQSNKRGILKNANYQTQNRTEQKEASFDEMNVLATHHPPDKDYGLMKIDEPKTPYHYDSEQSKPVDPETLARKLAEAGPSQKKRISSSASFSSDQMPPEERKSSKEFEDHRKQHYNMKEELQRGKELAARELAELDAD